MHWKTPPKIKVYEALGAIADKRIECDGHTARVFSSNRNKFYSVTYNPETRSIMCNDNGSFFVGYLGYPAIAFLMLVGELSFSHKFSEAVKGIPWKEMNQKNNNDFEMTLLQIHNDLKHRHTSIEEISLFVDNIILEIDEKKFQILGNKKAPPGE